jgi:hypothetical protein
MIEPDEGRSIHARRYFDLALMIYRTLPDTIAIRRQLKALLKRVEPVGVWIA